MVSSKQIASEPGGTNPRARPRRYLVPYFLIAPAVIVALAVAIVPLFYGMWLSLQDWYLLRSPAPAWGGLKNYRELLGDLVLWQAFGRTWFWTLGTVAVEFLLGVPFALLLNRKTFLSESLSAFILTPWVTPFIVAAYGWRYLLDSQVGLLHQVLELIGLVGNRSVLSDPSLSLAMITFISGWKGTPFMVIALLAALKGIPDELYEAARIDGAGRKQQFIHVTLPLLRNTAIVIGLVLGILAFYSFDLAWIMTQGGPSNSTRIIGIEIYRTFFSELRPAYAATISTSMLVVLLVAAMLTLRLRSRRV
jgi:multiple sugar transport system permease protein